MTIHDAPIGYLLLGTNALLVAFWVNHLWAKHRGRLDHGGDAFKDAIEPRPDKH